MICNVCGKELPEDSLFCKYCGSKLERNNVDDNTNNENVTELMPSNAVVQPLPNNSDVVVNVNQTLPIHKDMVMNVESPQFMNNNMSQNVVQPVQDMVNVAPEKGEKKIKKSKKKPIIIVGVLLLVIGLAILAVIFLTGRKLDRTIESFAQAYEDKDEDKLIKYMFPGSAIEGVQEFLDDNDIDLFDEFEELFGDDADLEELIIIDEEEVSDDLIADIDEILDEIDIDVEYEEIKIIVLSFEDSNDDNSGDVIRVISYKVGKTWYIVPGVLEYVEYLRQEDDIRHGERIATAIQTTLGLEAADTAIAPYYDVVISMDDLEYLPQAFSEEFKRCLEDTNYQLRHTEDGAIGYAYKISPSGLVEIYISSDTKMDEWKVYPEVDADYYNGIKEEVTGTVLSSDYSYVKLVSEKSPILGYWQSDKAGMYIGYNTSGGDEGFTIYSTINSIIHKYSGYEISGGHGVINYDYVNKYNQGNDIKYTFEVIDDNTIKLTVEYVMDGSSENYTFIRGDISQDIYKQYEGVWVENAFEPLYTNGRMELINCQECGCVHDYSNGEHMEDYYDDLACVSLYNGFDTIMYIYPDKGLYFELDDTAGHLRDTYTINGDELSYSTERCGGGGGMDFWFFREGSEQAKVAEALNAYQEYVKGDNMSDMDSSQLDLRYFGLFYLDDDNIPEAIVCDADSGRRLGYILTYSNGSVEEIELWWATYISFHEKQNKINVLTSATGGFYGQNFYIIENGKFVECASFNSMEEFAVPENTITYQYNGETVGEDVYNEKLEEMQQSFGTDTAIEIPTYSSWYEAYDNLK